MRAGDNVTHLQAPQVPSSMWADEAAHPVATAIASALALLSTVYLCHIWPAGWAL